MRRITWVLCHRGEGTKQSYTEAALWIRKSADQGNARAQYGLGNLYDTGKGVKQSHSEAAKWYLKAAEQGHATSQIYMRKAWEE